MEKFHSAKEALLHVITCISHDDYAEATKISNKLTKKYPAYPPFWIALSMSLKNNLEERLPSIKKSLLLQPSNDIALRLLSQYNNTVFPRFRMKYANNAIVVAPGSADNWITLVSAIRNLSIDCVFKNPERRAPVLVPNSCEAWRTAGAWYIASGERRAATQSLIRSLMADPSSVDSLYLLSLNDSNWIPAELIEKITLIFEEDKIVKYDSELASFALFAWHDNRRDEDLAFRWLQIGNRERRSRVPPASKLNHEILKRVINAPKPAICSNSDYPKNNPSPIFIIGIPGSGTTLVDAMLSMHNEIESAGELPILADMAMRLPDFPLGYKSLDTQELNKLSKQYETQSRQLSKSEKNS